MNSALLRLTQRHINRRLFQSLLFVIGIALGVAVGVAIDLANKSALRAFELSVSSVTGRTTHQIIGNVGDVPSDLYRQLRVELGLRRSAPVIETYVQATEFDNHTLRLLGVDPLAEAPFRSYLQTDDPGLLPALYTLVSVPNTGLISQTWAEREDIQVGDMISLRTPTQATVQVHVVGLLIADDNVSQQALENLLITDISTAQEIAGQPGMISRIDLILPDGYDVGQIEAILPPGTAITTPATSQGALSQMTSAFEINLQALSLLALLVGVFLIYNTVTFSVVQRRPVIGILRSLGTTRRQIFSLILTEALILGTIGTVLGLGLGIVLGQGAVRLVAQSINDLYFRVSVERIVIDPGILIKGAVIGITASLVAAVVPSYEATRTPPAGVMRRSAVEQKTRRLLPLITVGAIFLILGGVGVLQIRTENIILSFSALFLVLVGSALLTPAALVIMMRMAVPVMDQVFGVLGRMAARAVVRSLSRTAIAVAALTLAVSVIVGVSVMISSFRNTVADWLEITLGADIFIAPPSQGTARLDVNIDRAIADQAAMVPGVARVVTVRTVHVIAPDYPDLPPVNLTAPDGNITKRPRRFVWNHATNGDYWAALQAGQVVVSEPFAHRRNITPERNTITLLTDHGEQTFAVVGVYYDYTTDQGAVMMDQKVYRQFYDDPYLTAVALDLEAGADMQTVLDRLRTETLVGTGLQAQSNRSLRAGVLEIFDRTFSITIALRLLATLVAFIGILSALMALQLEHTRQYGIMRANGMTPRQLRTFTFIQTGLMGTTAGILAFPIGLALALILIKVINVRSFGWSMGLALGPQEFGQAFAVAVVAALVAGIYPAWRLSRLVAVQALRSE
ncbi:MAG TPA: FtsX-like permease family protein [Aggregatilineaceae bacterium]|nr:FtsX-like permease family protein [Aggregatilineaceae bacterium]